MLIYLSMIECEIERKSSDVLRAKKHTISTDFEASDPGIEMPQPGGGGLADAIAKLKPSYREAILLHYAYGYKTNGLARMLGMKPDTVRKLLWCAKTALRKKLEEEGVFLPILSCKSCPKKRWKQSFQFGK